jgi:cell division protein FtsX
MADQDRAQRAYEAYAKDAGGVSPVNRDPLPRWSILTADIRQHWQAAVDAVTDTDPVMELEIQGRMADEIERLIDNTNDQGLGPSYAFYTIGRYIGRIRYADALRKDRG